MLLAYKYLNSEKTHSIKILKIIGDYSFGIFFIHLMVMSFLNKIPDYKSFVMFPFNAIITLAISLLVVVIGRRIFGKCAKYLAF